jgi:hypothetical protein
MKRKPPPGNVRRVASIDRNIRGITTNKRGRLVQYESELERKLILVLERDAQVVDFASQPETLTFQDSAGRSRRYTPDFKVWRADGRFELHEVSVESRRTQPRLKEREAAASAICQERRWSYAIHTEQTLPRGNEYLNLSFLSYYRAPGYVSVDIVDWWQTQLSVQPGHTHPEAVLAMAASVIPQGALLSGLYYLIWHNQIGMDWSQPLIAKGEFHPRARIWLVENAAPGTDGSAWESRYQEVLS